MNNPLPQISCNKCNLIQQYRGQANCLHCGKRLNNWSVASQIAIWKQEEAWRRHAEKRNNDDEEDGA